MEEKVTNTETKENILEKKKKQKVLPNGNIIYIIKNERWPILIKWAQENKEKWKKIEKINKFKN